MSRHTRYKDTFRFVALATCWMTAAGTGCGTVVEHWQEVRLLDGGDTRVTMAGFHDCGTLDSFVAREVESPELHIIAIYEPYGWNSSVFVEVTRRGPLALFLSAYERTHWTVVVGPETTIDSIIVNGYYRQEVTIESPTGPVPDIPTTIISFSDDGVNLGFGHSWPTEEERNATCEDYYPADVCEFLGDSWESNLQQEIDELQELVDNGEMLTGRLLSSFHGCYRLSQFQLIETIPNPQ